MRIKELADLTGATVRAIRYYHQIGLLPVPHVRNGRRDYDLVHVARLARIRWLTEAGVPLSRIGAILGTPAKPRSGPVDEVRHAVLVDLRATLVSLDEQQDRLRVQRERIGRLVAAVEEEDHLSPMPRAVARFYDDLAQRTDDERVRRTIRRERDFMELAYYRGDMPAEAEIIYQGFTDAARVESLALFDRITVPEGSTHTPTDEEIEQVAAAAVARLRRQIGTNLSSMVRSIDPDIARRAADLYLRLIDDRGRRREARAIADAILAMIEEERSP